MEALAKGIRGDFFDDMSGKISEVMGAVLSRECKTYRNSNDWNLKEKLNKREPYPRQRKNSL